MSCSVRSSPLQGRMALNRLFVLFLGTALPLLFFFSLADAGKVGVSYGRLGNNLPSTASVVKLLKQSGITTVRLYDANPRVLKALANTGITVMVMLPNDHLAAAAADPASARRWVLRNVAAHYPATRIHGVAVGNEVFEEASNLTRQLVPAMANVHAALVRLGLDEAVKVSTPLAFTALQESWPPSAGRFRDDIARPVMKPMLDFLERTGSYLTVNAYPFFAYVEQPDKISLDYALGSAKAGVRDPVTGLVYHSLLDAQLDATFFAMEKLGSSGARQGNSLGRGTPPARAYVSESGWPSGGRRRPGRRLDLEAGGGAGASAAALANAKAYNNYLINRVLSCDTGTPYRPDADMDVYIFALFNENDKGCGEDDIEQHFGLFYPNQTKVYEFDFRGAAPSASSWCVANASAGVAWLQAALDWACGHGADCSDIQAGAPCFEPDTVVAHASHAFNSYYQRSGRASGTCDFAGAAYVVYHAPKIGNCVLPSQVWIQEAAAKSEGYAAI
ncbi:glucan endo-1,3-beta-glucosidase-like [Panicum virgatum]|uniref:X8 domain-containing protein n=1 Tax=Panicum virgatum TaxID=38727 RepID=A0A8T0WID4_PANVG|nr:glucan endo-1,3-beta-glucosidase-like [Panicum virgatum]KAG2645887.1 hypothetical protein PVAP13_2KG464105 [Panicum virgatum]